jgi:hypothetical protein
VWKPLIIEPISQLKLNKIENEKFIEFGGILGVLGTQLVSQI